MYVGIKNFPPDPDSPYAWEMRHSYSKHMAGRKGIGAEGHYSLILDFRGHALVQGTSVEIAKVDEFAFFLYDRNNEANTGSRFDRYFAHAAKDGLLDVMTTIGKEAVFIDVERAPFKPTTGRYTALRAWNSRFRKRIGWQQKVYRNKFFRTLYFVNSQVTVAGVERGVTKICRLEYSPLVVTNSDILVPAIETELARRADLIHAWRNYNYEIPTSRAAWRSAYESLNKEAFIPVMTVPKRHVGDFSVRTEVGEIAITFTRDPRHRHVDRSGPLEKSHPAYSDRYVFYVSGHLSVNGVDWGRIMRARVGVGTGLNDTIINRLKRQDFIEMEWKSTDEGSYRFLCGPEACTLFIKKGRTRIRSRG